MTDGCAGKVLCLPGMIFDSQLAARRPWICGPESFLTTFLMISHAQLEVVDNVYVVTGFVCSAWANFVCWKLDR
jgi:hypothetical protein